MDKKFDFEDGKGPVPAHKHKNGGGWVADTASVDATVYIGPSARDFENAWVSGDARVYGDSEVLGSSQGYLSTLGEKCMRVLLYDTKGRKWKTQRTSPPLLDTLTSAVSVSVSASKNDSKVDTSPRCKKCSKFITNDGRSYCDDHLYLESTKELAKYLSTVKPKEKNKVELVSIDTKKTTVPSKFEDRYKEIKEVLDYRDTTTLQYFGSDATKKANEVATILIEGIKARDVGAVGKSVTKMVDTIKEFRPESSDNLFGKFLALVGKHKGLLQYDKIDEQITEIITELDNHKDELMVQIHNLDNLCDASKVSFNDICVHIVAARAVLEEFKNELAKIEENTDSLDSVTESHRLQEAVTTLNQRIVDMLAVKTSLQQDVISVLHQQQLDKTTISKIMSVMEHTVPLWRQQVAKAMMLEKSRKASAAVKAAGDLTSDLVKENADNLMNTSKQVVRENSRLSIDVDAICHANEKLIETLQDARKVISERDTKFIEAEKRLGDVEKRLAESVLHVIEDHSTEEEEIITPFTMEPEEKEGFEEVLTGAR